MIETRKLLYTLLLLFISLHTLALPNKIYAQEQVTIVQADRGEGGIIDGEPIRRLLGNVELQSDRMYMYADSAYQFEERNLIQAFNIQIETDTDIIWADTLFHDTEREYSRFRGRVILLSELNLLLSESVDYDRILDMAHFNSPVRFEDEDGILLAEGGYYIQDADVAFFTGDVQLADSTQYLEADSLFMNRSAQYYRLHNRVYAFDMEENVTFSGHYLEADSAGNRTLANDAWMMQINEAGTDTSHLNAQLIHLTETDTSDFVDAYKEVRIWSESFSAVADTSHYRSDIEQFRLLSNPVVWQNRIQLTGPYIEAHLSDDQIEFLTSYPDPFAVQQDSLTGRLNQMKGDTLEAHFKEGEIDRIVVFDNSELIFHLKDENDQPDGLIELIAQGASIITFLNGELDNFKAEQNIDGSHLPEDPDYIDRRLSGFRWDPDMRPERPDIRQPRLPPVTEERPFELPERFLRYISDHDNLSDFEHLRLIPE